MRGGERRLCQRDRVRRFGVDTTRKCWHAKCPTRFSRTQHVLKFANFTCHLEIGTGSVRSHPETPPLDLAISHSRIFARTLPKDLPLNPIPGPLLWTTQKLMHRPVVGPHPKAYPWSSSVDSTREPQPKSHS